MKNDAGKNLSPEREGTSAFDLVVIGGGINGCGIARDAAGRGLSVCLLEMNDLASATSSASSKMVHGGLRYLENYEFRLVREALKEREVLLKIAPHLVQPLSFVFPHDKSMRPAWLIRLGLFLYDHLCRRRILHGSKLIRLARDRVGEALEPRYKNAFVYSDARVDDSRLVVLNAVSAAQNGAEIKTQTRCVSAQRIGDKWKIETNNKTTRKRGAIFARVLVNAAGPWVTDVINDCLGELPGDAVRLVKGSHIVVPKLFDHEKSYILQNLDRRVVFAIPYQRKFTLIGTTDVDFAGDPKQVQPSSTEVSYLCDLANTYFRTKTKPEDVVWKYSGVRPLYEDGVGKAQNATRDYILKLSEQDGCAPVLHIYGGKITTYRKLAEAALGRLHPYFPKMTADWTGDAELPGGSITPDFAIELRRDYPFLKSEYLNRLVSAYGSMARGVLVGVISEADLGKSFGAGLSALEVDYLINNEFATTAQDIIWRRSKLGLFMTEGNVAELEKWISGRKT